jgi:succinyl-CoA synthetase beta subunit
MATIDRVAYFGASAGNFCDLGGTPYNKLVIESLVLMEKCSNIQVILVNMFMNIPVTIICEAIKESFEHNYVSKPIVARLKGHQVDEGRQIL